MAIEQRLERLRQRRQGLDQVQRLTADSAKEIFAKSYLAEEAYVKRGGGTRYTKYALGSMQEVDADYTKISLEEAQRVRNQLASGLSDIGMAHDFRLQGSVPCNIHIRGVSDVDLLVLQEDSYSYELSGYKALMGFYTSPAIVSSLTTLKKLRAEVERILTQKFYAADVDVSGAKAVKISKGSLRRPVDVVPSHWHDTVAFQASGKEFDRGVYILNKTTGQKILNMPFMHIKKINERDVLALGGLKKAIRLCKNVKADAIDDGKTIDLPSFDIASVMWHADVSALRAGDLAVLAETQRLLDLLATNLETAKSLDVPDGTRKIFDSSAKLLALDKLSCEIDDLMLEVASEQKLIPNRLLATPETIRRSLSAAYLP